MHERGTGPATPVVLVHGIGVARLYFEPLAELLAASGRVIIVELPGFGRAPKQRPSSPPTIEEHALLLAALLRDAGAAPYRLVGHSMGTQIVADLAARDPELVAEIALLGPATGLGCARRAAAGSPARARHPGGVARREHRRVHRLPPYRSALVPADASFMLGYPMLDVLPRISAPAVVNRGSRDPIAPHDWTAEVAARLPRGRFVEVPGANHVVQFTHPQAIAAELGADPR